VTSHNTAKGSAKSPVNGPVKPGVKPRDLVDSRQLLRLRLLREAAALREMGQARDHHAKAWQQVQDRHEHIALVQRELKALGAWVQGDNLARAARLAPYAQACEAKLMDELERARYDLIDEQKVLDDASHALSEARAFWLRAQSRQQAVQQLTHDTQRALGVQHEQRMEREL
jgi:hypothetical protein